MIKKIFIKILHFYKSAFNKMFYNNRLYLYLMFYLLFSTAIFFAYTMKNVGLSPNISNFIPILLFLFFDFILTFFFIYEDSIENRNKRLKYMIYYIEICQILFAGTITVMILRLIIKG